MVIHINMQVKYELRVMVFIHYRSNGCLLLYGLRKCATSVAEVHRHVVIGITKLVIKYFFEKMVSSAKVKASMKVILDYHIS
jgi:hypothetical protein